MPSNDTLDAVIVGAGFAGMYMLHRLRTAGFRARVLERGGGVGGTWYWNRYPGARCDIESMEYSYGFDEALQQEWVWRERYAPQPEILRYAEHVAERLDLMRDIELGVSVTAASFHQAGNGAGNKAGGFWSIETADGRALRARFLVMAVGCLSSTNLPDFAGLESFRGRTYHTGAWPHEGVDFTGKRVAVVGTGSSAVQSIPVIAEQAALLHVFQRTASYVVPAHNRPLGLDEQQAIKARYAELRAKARLGRTGQLFPLNPKSALEVTAEEREAEYEARWQTGGLTFTAAFIDQITNKEANEAAADFVRRKIRSIVDDPRTAELLCPSTVIACKRLCVCNGYYETYNRPNVELVDVSRTPIAAITPEGLRVGARDFAVDAIVFATGFDAMTGSLLKVDIRGRDGQSLRQRWAEGPVSYLGLAVAGFPNLFTITGPGSPSVLSNMIPSIEQHVEWIGNCIEAMRQAGQSRIEAEEEAQAAWVAHVGEIAGRTLFPSCNSWYLGANVPGKPRVFMPYLGCPPYRQRCEQIAAEGYTGFALS